jgi:hypothetical protein
MPCWASLGKPDSLLLPQHHSRKELAETPVVLFADRDRLSCIHPERERHVVESAENLGIPRLRTSFVVRPPILVRRLSHTKYAIGNAPVGSEGEKLTLDDVAAAHGPDESNGRVPFGEFYAMVVRM